MGRHIRFSQETPDHVREYILLMCCSMFFIVASLTERKTPPYWGSWRAVEMGRYIRFLGTSLPYVRVGAFVEGSSPGERS